MNIRQIGNGGAFDYQSVNSSFVIEHNDKYLLFDCGYSVYAELRRLDADEKEDFDLKKLDAIYISHMDDDHVGSIKTLLYYQYFVNGITTKVMYQTGTGLEDDIECELLFHMDTKRENDEEVNASIWTPIYLPLNGGTIWNTLEVHSEETDHHVECYGLRVFDINEEIYISGDTKATKQTADVMEGLLKGHRDLLIFHDFSNWDCEGSQVHACKSDTERLYSPEIREKINWYHNNEPFNNQWRSV